MENNENDFYAMQIGNEECMVNRNQETLQRLTTFEDLYPHFDEENGLHCKTNDMIYPLRRCVIGCTRIEKDCGSDTEYHQALCETKSLHVNSMIRNLYAMGINKPSIIQNIGIL